MAETKTSVVGAPAWLDLSSSDAQGSRDYYSKVFGWKVEVNPDPQYGGYAMAQLNGKDVAGIGPAMSPGAPTAWTVYIGVKNADETAKKATEAGGKVIAPVMNIGSQGRMLVIQDPSGGVLGAWEPGEMKGAGVMQAPNSMVWAELNSRGVDQAIPFYKEVFGWTEKKSEMPEGQPPYSEFQQHGESVGGATAMNPMVPAEVPSYWLAYFGSDNVDKKYEEALAAGGKEMLPPMDFPGGRFAIVQDPQGAAFGILDFKQ